MEKLQKKVYEEEDSPNEQIITTSPSREIKTEADENEIKQSRTVPVHNCDLANICISIPY